MLRNQRRYRDLLGFLQQGGAALAAAQPRIASQLAGVSQDPDVERLLEGVAYRSSQILSALDDHFPVLVQLVTDLFFPHYLSPLPAAAVVQCESEACVRIPRHAELTSLPVQGTRCRFRTTADVDIGPLQVVFASWEASRQGATLSMRFGPGAVTATSDSLEVFLYGDHLVTNTVYQWLLTRLAGIEWTDAAGTSLGEASGIELEPVGFGAAEALLPYPDGASAGLRWLQEYFLLPEKFSFIRFKRMLGEMRAKGLGSQPFGVRFHLRGEAGPALQLGARNIRLNCVPVVNVFPHPADPVACERGTIEVPLRAAGQQRHYEVYRVLEVGVEQGSGTVRYPLAHELCSQEFRAQPFAQVYREAKAEGEETVLLLNRGESGIEPDGSVVMADLLCTNGRLASALRPGDICELSERSGVSTAGVRVHNITAVVPGWPAPRGETLRQAIALHLAAAQRQINNASTLRELLSLYNFRSLADAQSAREHDILVSAVRQVTSQSGVAPYHGEMARYVRTDLEFDESAFSSEGELFLFGSILDRLLAYYTAVNQVSELCIRGYRTHKVLRFAPRVYDGSVAS